MGAGAFEGGVDAAEGAAAGHQVAFYDTDGEAGAFGFGTDVAEEGAGAEAEAGFVAAHAGAQAASEDADFVRGVDGSWLIVDSRVGILLADGK